MNSVKIEAPAKINLTLDVIGVRPNGYHDVCMVMQTIGIHDTVEIIGIPEGIRLVLTNPMSKMGEGCVGDYVPCDEHNIAYKAAALFLETLKEKSAGEPAQHAAPMTTGEADAEGKTLGGVEVRITKRIPVAAGLAGGSTDAAAVLKGMNILFGDPFTEEELITMSPKLGADVAFCVMGGTALSEGIGEILTKLPSAAGIKLLVAKPDIQVSTKEVYTALDSQPITQHPDNKGMLDAIAKKDVAGIASLLGNVLADVTMPRHPEIAEIRDVMLQEGALNAMMSGSGPTVFGIFTDDNKAAEALGRLMDLGYTQLFFTATV